MPGKSPPPTPSPSLAERLAIVTAIIQQLPESLVADRVGKTPQQFALHVLAETLENPSTLPGSDRGPQGGTAPRHHRRRR